MKTHRILIMAGGTGGHVFPALALAEALRAKGHQVTWLGTANKIEAKVVPQARFEIDFLSISSLRGKGFFTYIGTLFRLWRAVHQAVRVMQQRKPELVIGLGGFAAGPGGLAARKLKIPLVIHEQNALAGLTNRVLAHFATRVYTGFDGAFANKKIKTETVGNPLRESFVKAVNKAAINRVSTDLLHILVVGGSLGASALNQIVPKALALLPAGHFEIWHQTGEKTLAMTQDNYQQVNVPAKVLSFIDDMPTAYQWADVVICRAGALTVAELAAMGKAAILVPLPSAADDHQRYNAEYLSKQGAGICLLQKDLTPEHLAAQLTPWLTDLTALTQLGQQARRLARLDATVILAKKCEQLLNEIKKPA